MGVKEILVKTGLPSIDKLSVAIIDNSFVRNYYMSKLIDYGVELLDIRKAWREHREEIVELLEEIGLRDKIIIDDETVGLYIKVKPGSKPPLPLYACFVLSGKGIVQRIVNIIDIGENSDVTVIKGCASIVPEGAHQAVTLLKARGNNKITSLMIHNWAPYITVSSKTYAFLGDNVEYNGYYVKISPVKAIGLGAEYYVGENSSVEYHEASIAHKDTRITSNTMIILKGRNSRGMITSRGVVDKGYMNVNPLIRAENNGVKGHIECQGLVLRDGVYKTHPSLETLVEEAYLTHEASIGKISGEQLFYLQTRGLNEEAATKLIVLGFLSSALKGLPEDMKKYMDSTMKYFIIKDKRFL